MFNAFLGCRRCFFGSLAVGDIAPRADHLGRLAVLVTYQLLRIVHPAVAAVLLEKPVLDRVATFLEQLDGLGLDRGEVIRMHATAPEIGVFQILTRLVAEPVADVLADECRCEVSRRLEAVNHRRRAGEQLCQLGMRCGFGLLRSLPRGDVAP